MPSRRDWLRAVDYARPTMWEKLREANRANWDERAYIHVRSRMYDVEGFLGGAHTIADVDLDAVGDVRGRSLVQLQCHFGLDAMSWARLGATAVGVDFSPRALAHARDIATRAGLAVRFVEADVYDAATALDGERFDVVYVSLGALCWLPSIRRWARVVRDLLKPGGIVFVRDVHPVLWATESPGPAQLDLLGPYFETQEPHVGVDDRTYVEGDARVGSPTTYEWNHGLGEIVQALIDERLVLERLDEHRFVDWPAFDWLERHPDGHYRMPESQRDRLPLCFSLLARARVGDPPHP